MHTSHWSISKTHLVFSFSYGCRHCIYRLWKRGSCDSNGSRLLLSLRTPRNSSVSCLPRQHRREAEFLHSTAGPAPEGTPQTSAGQATPCRPHRRNRNSRLHGCTEPRLLSSSGMEVRDRSLLQLHHSVYNWIRRLRRWLDYYSLIKNSLIHFGYF